MKNFLFVAIVWLSSTLINFHHTHASHASKHGVPEDLSQEEVIKSTAPLYLSPDKEISQTSIFEEYDYKKLEILIRLLKETNEEAYYKKAVPYLSQRVFAEELGIKRGKVERLLGKRGGKIKNPQPVWDTLSINFTSLLKKYCGRDTDITFEEYKEAEKQYDKKLKEQEVGRKLHQEKEGMTPKVTELIEIISNINSIRDEIKKAIEEESLNNIKSSENYKKLLEYGNNAYEEYWHALSYSSVSFNSHPLRNFEPTLSKKKVEFDKWPHQSWQEALCGWLFFPQELEELYDPLISIYGRIHIHYKLAYSASFQNPLAYYHLSRVIGNFNMTSEDEGMNKLEEVFLNKAQEYLEKARPHLKREDPASSFIPFNFAYERLKWHLGKIDAPLSIAEAREAEDVRRAYYCALYLGNDPARQQQIYEKIQPSYSKALLGLAKSTKNIEDAIKLYIQAGEADIAEGYYHAGNLILAGHAEDKYLKDNGIKYLKIAGEKGCLSAYDALASYYKNADNLVEAEKAYQDKGEKGDGRGFYDLAELYLSNNKKEKAKEYYLKSGALIGYFEAADLEEDPDKEEEILQRADTFYEEHFLKLQQIAGRNKND